MLLVVASSSRARNRRKATEMKSNENAWKCMLTASAFAVSKEVIACASQDRDYLGQVRGTTAAWCLQTRECYPPRWARWIRNLCRFKKNLHLAVDGGWPLPARDLSLNLRWRRVQKRFDRCGQLCSHGSAMKVVTDGWSVDPGFIPDGDQIVSKTYMTRVEGENTRQRHSASSTASQDTVLFQIRRTTETLN